MTRSPSPAPKERRRATPPAAPRTAPAPLLQLRPRPRLFVVLMALLALWTGALLVMYFTTVYPRWQPTAVEAPAPAPPR